jgi:hypothetical protein
MAVRIPGPADGYSTSTTRLTTLTVVAALGLSATLLASRPPSRGSAGRGDIVAEFDAVSSVRLLDADGGGAVIQGKAGVKIDSLPTQQIFEIGGIGGRRDDKSGAWACDTLELEVSMSDVDAWLGWDAEAVAGKNTPRSMTVELLDASMKDTLLTLQAQGVTIIRADPGLSDGGVNRPGRVQLAVHSWSAK